MKSGSEHHRRRSIRLKGYDYSRAGAYFVTICAQDRLCLFADVVDGEIRLNDYGGIVHQVWNELPHHYDGVELDAFVVMPNHIHGVIVILDDTVGVGFKPAPSARGRTKPAPSARGRAEPAPSARGRAEPGLTQSGRVCTPKRHALPEFVRAFKTFSARWINALRGISGVPVWQRNYYEHIIRNDESLHRIRDYIANNPSRWGFDHENPAAAVAEPEDAWLG